MLIVSLQIQIETPAKKGKKIRQANEILNIKINTKGMFRRREERKQVHKF